MKPLRIKTISEFHQMNQLPPPEHPLISVVDYAQVVAAQKDNPTQSTVADYYSIAVKRGLAGKMHYGQQEYDFDEGVMYFLAPKQVLQASPAVGLNTTAFRLDFAYSSRLFVEYTLGKNNETIRVF